MSLTFKVALVNQIRFMGVMLEAHTYLGLTHTYLESKPGPMYGLTPG